MKKLAPDVVNPFVAGIDVGSRSHYVAIGQTDEDVKEFGVYNEDLIALTQRILDNGITTIAMESTGTYWQSLFATPQSTGLEVLLCNGKFTKTIKGKKADVRIVSGYKNYTPNNKSVRVKFCAIEFQREVTN